ncbi:IclR family transcriptional regulator [Jiangella alba]|uniref:Transcriptional regulator, IclR family n=1 Tax=Jiangella alba TaxID=561176 RepID=A0A1H5J334_9ACTN|nr:helix-turn-helix domain-containing protein [Jiangella alba]SEE46854.1 transcriptional regulator, IclR family [Jiangella alba]
MTEALPLPPSGGSVEKAFALVAELAAGAGPQRLGDLAARVGITKPTAHRLLRSLTALGYVRPLGAGAYTVGPALVGVAAATLGALKDRPLVRRSLDDLHVRTGLTASYAIRSGAAAVVVDNVEPDQAYRVSPRLGVPVPLEECAAGTAMLAAAEGRALPGEYAYDDGEPVRSLAAAVTHHRGVVAGALVVSGLSFTLNAESAAVLGPLVAEQARLLSATLQAMLPPEAAEGIA